MTVARSDLLTFLFTGVEDATRDTRWRRSHRRRRCRRARPSSPARQVLAAAVTAALRRPS